MAEKNKGAIDPIAIRELISQGIPMKKKESEMIPPPTVEEEDASVSETQKEAKIFHFSMHRNMKTDAVWILCALKQMR